MSDADADPHRSRPSATSARPASCAPPGQPEPVRCWPPTHPVLGVDACPAGGSASCSTATSGASVFVAPTIVELVGAGAGDAATWRSSRSTSRSACPTAAVAWRTPRRGGCWSARRPRSSPPPPAPRSRPHLRRGAGGQPRRHRRCTSVSAQAYALREKVLQVDAWVRSRPGVARDRGAPRGELRADGRIARPGAQEGRRRGGGPALRRWRRHGITAPHWFRGAGFGEDDLLDACAAAWSARPALARRERVVPRPAGGLLRRHPGRHLGLSGLRLSRSGW